MKRKGIFIPIPLMFLGILFLNGIQIANGQDSIELGKVIVTDNLDSFIDLSNQTDTDASGDRELVVRWNFDTVNVKDIHVYVLANNEGKIKYLGRTGDGTAKAFSWNIENRLVAGEYKKGPQSNHSYRFGIYLLQERGPQAVVGPFFTAGPVAYQIEENPAPTITPTVIPDATDTPESTPTPENTPEPTATPTLISDATDIPENTPTPTATPTLISDATPAPDNTPTPIAIPPNSVIVTDTIDSTDDLSNGVDYDPADKRELVVRWNIIDFPARDYHVYAQVDGSTKREYVGRAGNGGVNYYQWNSKSRFVTGRFKNGPQPEHSYRFMVYAISLDEDVKPFGPIQAAGPVKFMVGEENPPVEPTPEIPIDSVIVTDDLYSFVDLSNGEDRDPAADRELAIRWNFPDIDAKDVHVYVLINNEGKPKYLGRTGKGDAQSFQWRQGNRLIAGTFKNGPISDNQYRFYIYFINQKGPKAFTGPFATAGPVAYVVETPIENPSPTPTTPEEQPTPIPTVPEEQPTPTPTVAEELPTPTPTVVEEQPTPTPTVVEEQPTPTPTVLEEQPTPTPTVAEEQPTPTPTVAEELPTPTPTPTIVEEQPTPTPTVLEEEPTPTQTPTPTVEPEPIATEEPEATPTIQTP